MLSCYHALYYGLIVTWLTTWPCDYRYSYLMQSESIMLADKHKIEKEQNAQLRNQVAQLLHLEQEQKMLIEQRDSTVQTLQVALHLHYLLLYPGLDIFYGYYSEIAKGFRY